MLQRIVKPENGGILILPWKENFPDETDQDVGLDARNKAFKDHIGNYYDVYMWIHTHPDGNPEDRYPSGREYGDQPALNSLHYIFPNLTGMVLTTKTYCWFQSTGDNMKYTPKDNAGLLSGKESYVRFYKNKNK